MPTELQTPNRAYPLPFKENGLSFDVLRLVAALGAIDYDIQVALSASGSYAPLVSPAFSGVPTAPTATAGANSTQIATTAFVKAAIDAILDGAPAALNTLKEIADALGDDEDYAATITAALADLQDQIDGLGVYTPARFLFTAAGGETSFSGADDNAATLAFTAGREQVFMNGVLLVPGVDYGTSGGDTITALAALQAGDTVQVWAF